MIRAEALSGTKNVNRYVYGRRGIKHRARGETAEQSGR